MSGAWSVWPAPAKLNLFLHVVDRRADGYHSLQTVFQLLDWCDSVRLRCRGDGRIERLGELPGVDAEDDLCVRAARLLKAETGSRWGADIAVDKQLPMAAGLGGGSSDAATVLVALNALWGTGRSTDELAALGLRLGADVPVFVRGYSSFAEGIGELLTPVNLPSRWYAVIDSGQAIATRDAFAAVELTAADQLVTIPRFVAGMPTRNAFQSVLAQRHPRIAQALEWLGRHGQARLTGTGGAVFAAFSSCQKATQAVQQCPPGMRGWAVRGMARSPLLDALGTWHSAGRPGMG